MAVVTKLSNLLIEAGSKNPEVLEYISTTDGWRAYEDETLNQTNLQEETKLGTSKKESIEDNILYLLLN